jgi:hypothetical protein
MKAVTRNLLVVFTVILQTVVLQGAELPRKLTDRERSELSVYFPQLNVEEALVTGEATKQYNCIAWSVGNTKTWDWPPLMYPELSATESVRAYYRDRGYIEYEPKPDEILENGTVAYWQKDVTPKHASVLKSQNSYLPWESKLGTLVRIAHNRDELESESYGKIVAYFVKAPLAISENSTFKMSVKKLVEMNAKLKLDLIAVDPQLKLKFDTFYADWLSYRKKNFVSGSADPNLHISGSAYYQLLKLGPDTLPLFIDKMLQGDFFCRKAVESILKFQVSSSRKSEQQKAYEILLHWLGTSQ